MTILVQAYGSGSVRSTDGTIACSGLCSFSVPAGKTIVLTGVPGAGSRFSGFDRPCIGATECSITVSADTEADAVFVLESPPAYNPTGLLDVRRSGAGRVTSHELGIDCGNECETYFWYHGPVTLTATPAEGFTFTKWSGACNGTAPTCVIDMEADFQEVTAEFEHVKPLPDGCAALMPASLPAPVTVDLGAGSLVDAKSDSTGTNFLFSVRKDFVSGSREYHFVHIAEGVATELAVRQGPVQNDATGYEQPVAIASQPRGFVIFRNVNDGLVFDTYAPDGTLLRTTAASRQLRAGETSESDEFRMVPSGGVAVIRRVWSANDTYTTEYARFDEQGIAQVTAVPVDRGAGFIATWDVDANGNVLLVDAQGPGGYGDHDVFGRWLNRAGQPLTPWFAGGNQYVRNPFVLQTPSGLALGDSGMFSLTFADAQSAATDAPRWLSDRAETHVKLVRGGAAFASYGTTIPESPAVLGVCGEAIEVLKADGTSCGCLTLPQFPYGIGSDGSVFAAGTGGLAVYPGLLR